MSKVDDSDKEDFAAGSIAFEKLIEIGGAIILAIAAKLAYDESKKQGKEVKPKPDEKEKKDEKGENGENGEGKKYKTPTSGSGKEKADDIPSWAEGEKPYVGESGREFAERLLDAKYGKGNYKKGAGSEYQKLQKNGDRGYK